MKLNIFLFILTIVQVWATETYSQLTKLTLRLENVKISEALREIENQSEFFFLYSPRLIDVEREVTIDAEKETIGDILTDIFADKVKFAVYDRQVILTPKDQTEVLTTFQQQIVTGKVTDKSGAPLPGVNVTVKGTTTGATTDIDGNFSLTLPPEAQTLTFSFVGMSTHEVTIGTQTIFNIVLEESAFGLEEVVVIGYGTQKKVNLTGSVATVGTKELTEIPSANLVQRLQGRISGVSIINSHVPGGDALVRVRGLSTINNNDPLYVIDGVPTKVGLSQLNPNDMESITVLKDAASAAIYGASGANGVIIVTTIKGKTAEPKISFNARNGISQIVKTYDLLNTQEYGELLWLESANDGIAPGNQIYGYGTTPSIPVYILPARAVEGSPEVDPSLYSYDPKNLYLIMKANKEGTDWFDEILRTAHLQEYNLSISGGSDKAGYAFSAGYVNEQGIQIYTGFKRYSIRANSNAKFKNWLEVGESLGLTFTEGYGNRGNNNENATIFAAVRVQPIIPVYDIMGNFGGTKAPATSGGENPVATLTRDANDYNRNLRSIGNAYAQASIIKGLKYKSLFGFDLRYGASKDIFIKNLESSMATSTDALTEGSNYAIQ